MKTNGMRLTSTETSGMFCKLRIESRFYKRASPLSKWQNKYEYDSAFCEHEQRRRAIYQATQETTRNIRVDKLTNTNKRATKIAKAAKHTQGAKSSQAAKRPPPSMTKSTKKHHSLRFLDRVT